MSSMEKMITFHCYSGEYVKLETPKLESEMKCPRCGGTSGYSWPVDPKVGPELMWFCGNDHCLQLDKNKQQNEIKRARAIVWKDFCIYHNIGDKYWNVCMEDVQQSAEILKKLIAFASKPEGIIMLSGTAGTGKSYASLAVAEYFTRTQSDASFFLSSELSERWANRYNENAYNLTRKVKENSLLIIDDFAQVDPMPGFMSYLFEIINHRTQWSNKGTILTTNHNAKKIAEICGEALLDRIKKGIWIETKGQSRR